MIKRDELRNSLATLRSDTGITLLEVSSDAVKNIIRRIGRSCFTASGTMLGVAAIVATIGLAQSAQASVSSAFNLELSTQVAFQSTSGSIRPSSEHAIQSLRGVIQAGYVAPLNAGQSFGVSNRPISGDGTPLMALLPITIATPDAISTMQVKFSSGRAYDAGASRRGINEVILGLTAANQLGIANATREPTIFVDSVPLIVIGIADKSSQQSQILSGVIVTPLVGNYLSHSVGPAEIIARTRIGAAQVVGNEGPLAIDHSMPSDVVAEVPPNPTYLRQKIESSVSSLLLALGALSLLIGMVSIANVTLLSVLERGSEFGIRRAVGARARDIACLIICEAGIVGGLGGVIGMSLGVVLTLAISVSKQWTPVVSSWVIVASPILGLCSGLAAGLYPSFRASRTNIVSSLQNG